MEFKLINVTVPGSGRVVYELEGDPGAFCLLNTPSDIHDPLAIAACRELGYVDGVLLLEEDYRTSERIQYQLPRYPDRHANTFLGSVKCVGNESMVRDCAYELLDRSDYAEDPCTPRMYYKECAYARAYAGRAKSTCQYKDLSVRCHASGLTLFLYSLLPKRQQIYHRSFFCFA